MPCLNVPPFILLMKIAYFKNINKMLTFIANNSHIVRYVFSNNGFLCVVYDVSEC